MSPHAEPGASAFAPIADYGLIGDCRTAALVSRSGSIDWCCLPRFDSGSIFASLLDTERGGYCALRPVDSTATSHRTYLDDALVLETIFEAREGSARVLDCLAIPAGGVPTAGGSRLLRVLEGLRGTVEFELRIVPRFDYGALRPWIRDFGDHLHTAAGGNDALIVWSDAPISETEPHVLSARFTVHAGERLRCALTYARPEELGEPPAAPAHGELDADLERTIGWWRDWLGRVPPSEDARLDVRRSAMVLKALTNASTGAIVAAPTTSLPEAIPGERNWDYRYAWVRDASFSARAFAEIGCAAEADAFRHFIRRATAGHADELQIVYGPGGERRIGVQGPLALSGYRGIGPVRLGNAAAGQLQLDALGELVNLTWRWHRRGHSAGDDQWRFLVSLIDRAAEEWEHPDHGLWEWPGEPDHFVHSKVSCWAALDRGLRLAEESMRRAPTRRWKHARDELREAIEEHGYDRWRGVFTQAFDRPELDAALLLLPTVEFLAWDDERMLRTVAAVREELSAGGCLLYRYRREDGIAGEEGAFLCCSFWLVECLARAGEHAEALEVFDQALACGNDLGLFAEEAEPESGELRGNFPQGLTHLAHISAAVALAETRPG